MNSKRIVCVLTCLAGLALLAACQGQQALVPTYTPLPTYTPYPTHTSLPTVTPTPTVTPDLTPEVRLAEDFSGEQTCFETFDRPQAAAGLEQGTFVLELRSGDQITFADCQTLVAGDFHIEVEATPLEWPQEGTYYYGLTFRVSGQERYVFAYGSEGGYCAYYTQQSTYIPLTSSTDYATRCWVRLPGTPPLPGATVRLAVTAVGDRFDLYLDGEPLSVVRDHKLSEGWLGFVAAASDGLLRVAFDNLQVSRH